MPSKSGLILISLPKTAYHKWTCARAMYPHKSKGMYQHEFCTKAFLEFALKEDPQIPCMPLLVRLVRTAWRYMEYLNIVAMERMAYPVSLFVFPYFFLILPFLRYDSLHLPGWSYVNIVGSKRPRYPGHHLRANVVPNSLNPEISKFRNCSHGPGSLFSRTQSQITDSLR